MIAVVNWSPYNSLEKLENLLNNLIEDPKFSAIDYRIALPYHFLLEIAGKFTYPNLTFGLSSMNSVSPGTFTEDVAIDMLKKAKAHFVLIGTFQSESAETINKKIIQTLSAEITPYLCIGDKDIPLVKEVLKNLTAKQLKGFTLLYESEWQQSTFKPSTKEIVDAYVKLKKKTSRFFGKTTIPTINHIFPYLPYIENEKSFLGKVGGQGFYFSVDGFITAEKLAKFAAPSKILLNL